MLDASPGQAAISSSPLLEALGLLQALAGNIAFRAALLCRAQGEAPPLVVRALQGAQDAVPALPDAAHWAAPLFPQFYQRFMPGLPIACDRFVLLTHGRRCLYSVRRNGNMANGAYIALHRAMHDGPFSDEETSCVHRLHARADGAAVVANQAPRPPLLSPRKRQVLGLLLEGCSEKEAAWKLGISGHTVHVYIKSLYEQFRVGSRAELMSLFLKRAGMAGGLLVET